jgi:5-methylcytosine-specific restriction endonuclease McrA
VVLGKRLRDEEVKGWLEFRLQFLNSHELVCHYCGKQDLLIEVPTNSKSDLAKLATIDHKKPVSKGGGVYDTDNCVVSCYPCNQKKGDNENFNLGRH